jgi:hypothetical protein
MVVRCGDGQLTQLGITRASEQEQSTGGKVGMTTDGRLETNVVGRKPVSSRRKKLWEVEK